MKTEELIYDPWNLRSFADVITDEEVEQAIRCVPMHFATQYTTPNGTSTGVSVVNPGNKTPLDSLVTIQLDGTHTGLTFQVQKSIDGTNGWCNTTVFEDSGANANTVYPGTSIISPSDTTSHIYHVPNVQNVSGVRVNVLTQSGGTANWRFVASTNVGPGINPVSGGTVSQSGGLAFPRNLIDGGDFAVNPWQRGTAAFTGITSAVTYTADRWFAIGGASSSITVSQGTDATRPGFSNTLKFQRAAANANTAVINLGQVLETLDSIRCQGQSVTLSFYAKAGANFSAAGSLITVALNHSVTAGNDTAAHLAAASTNWQAVPTVINTTQALTTTMTRYSFTGTVPATATQLGLLLSFTPVGTAGADDSFSIDGVQLEVGGSASPFEHRDIEMEIALCQRYYFRITEVNGATFAIGSPAVGANLQTYSIALPTLMRSAPTVTWTVGGFKLIIDGAANAAPTTPAAGSAHSLSVITLSTSNVLTAAAHSVALVGTGTTGFIDASADL
jgi:hypothetical protein